MENLEHLAKLANLAGGPPALKIGDTVTIRTDDANRLHWSLAGNVLKLAAGGTGPNVVLAVSEFVEGPSPPQGSPIISPLYIRFSTTGANPRFMHLDGFDADNLHNVPIDNQHNTKIVTIFFMVKIPGAAGNSPGNEIRRGDAVHIRCT